LASEPVASSMSVASFVAENVCTSAIAEAEPIRPNRTTAMRRAKLMNATSLFDSERNHSTDAHGITSLLDLDEKNHATSLRIAPRPRFRGSLPFHAMRVPE